MALGHLGLDRSLLANGINRIGSIKGSLSFEATAIHPTPRKVGRRNHIWWEGGRRGGSVAGQIGTPGMGRQKP